MMQRKPLYPSYPTCASIASAYGSQNVIAMAQRDGCGQGSASLIPPTGGGVQGAEAQVEQAPPV